MRGTLHVPVHPQWFCKRGFPAIPHYSNQSLWQRGVCWDGGRRVTVHGPSQVATTAVHIPVMVAGGEGAVAGVPYTLLIGAGYMGGVSTGWGVQMVGLPMEYGVWSGKWSAVHPRATAPAPAHYAPYPLLYSLPPQYVVHLPISIYGGDLMTHLQCCLVLER